MISPGELYDLEEEVPRLNLSRAKQSLSELIHEIHRLRHLVEEMADFRHSKEHEDTMKSLKNIEEKIAYPRDV